MDPLTQAIMQRQLPQEQAPQTTQSTVTPATPPQSEQVDPLVQKAFALLDQKSRPSVPVRLYEDPEQLWRDVLSKGGQRHLTANAVGAVPDDKSAIYISKRFAEANDPYMLASKIIHENAHINAQDRLESKAYEQELGYVNKNRLRFRQGYPEALDALMRSMHMQEKDAAKQAKK
jgi:hypothetical protein